MKGLYFWGGVGRGKTYLVDTFFESLPFEQKVRTHFHRFMKRVHEELKTLGREESADHHRQALRRRGAGDLLRRILRLRHHRCDDPRHPAGRAVQERREPGGDLQHRAGRPGKDGLQRARFLPAIALLKEHTEIVNVDSGVDYRLRALEQAELFHWPLSEQVEEEWRAASRP